MHAPDHMLADRFGAPSSLHRRDLGPASDLPRERKNAPRFRHHSPIRANHGSRASLSAFERQPMSIKHSQTPLPDGDDGKPTIHADQTRPPSGNGDYGSSAPLAHRYQSVITARTRPPPTVANR